MVRILRGIAGALSLSGDVLILGDSTSAYCVDREQELSWRDLRDKAKEARGVNFFFESWSGATPAIFLTRRKTPPGGVARTTGWFFWGVGIPMEFRAMRYLCLSRISSRIAMPI